ncbi:MAG: 50S ribosomal protein L24 [Candidatus Omnitrophica bacterium]|nr:50S ribosomal protein L24 [Candidatus Omnitrophota bacterium]MBU1090377.1 50S ribosomal protein L24 [Candidatus Omnitrophota bacterium]MBU1906016.1 50S ribosomal protein L24 [Candidatus Omnitrophota bacterium]
MQKIKKGDLVQVIKGKDTGKKGKVLNILPEAKVALIEGVNLVKKHKRQSRQDQQGGILSIEAPMNLSNLAVFCKQCNSPKRMGFTLLKDGTKSRICRCCKGNV